MSPRAEQIVDAILEVATDHGQVNGEPIMSADMLNPATDKIRAILAAQPDGLDGLRAALNELDDAREADRRARENTSRFVFPKERDRVLAAQEALEAAVRAALPSPRSPA